MTNTNTKADSEAMMSYGLSNNDGDGGCSFLAVYAGGPMALVRGLGPMVHNARRPSGAVLHSSSEPDVRRLCSDFMDMLRRLINCCVIIIIIIIMSQKHILKQKRSESTRDTDNNPPLPQRQLPKCPPH